MMLIMQGLSFNQIFLYQFKETKPKTVPKGKVDDFVISYNCNFLVDGNIRIIHWPVFHSIQSSFVYQTLPGRKVFPYFTKCFNVLELVLTNFQPFSKVAILLSLSCWQRWVTFFNFSLTIDFRVLKINLCFQRITNICAGSNIS